MTKSVKDLLQHAVKSIVIDVQTTAKRAGYVPIRTGTLKRSITHKVDLFPTGSSVVSDQISNYARIHEKRWVDWPKPLRMDQAEELPLTSG